MTVNGMKLRTRWLAQAAALALTGLALSGCVVYPQRGYASAYYEPAYVAPPPVVVVGGGWGWGGGWRGGHHWR
jgi:hypothetical protein